MQLFAGRFRDDVDAAIERIVFVEQDEVGAAAAKKLGEHFAKVDPHLGERFGKELFGRLIDPGDHVEQFAARIRQVGHLCFEESVALFEFVVFLDGVEVDRSHRVELAGHLLDDFPKPRFVESRSRLRSLSISPLPRCLIWARKVLVKA